MKTQHIRPKVHNGPIARRAAPRQPAAKSAARSRQAAEAPARRSDSRVFWIMVLVGALLTAGFVLGLRSQINAHQLNQAEEKLKDELDRQMTHEKFLSVEQQRARSPREIERVRKEAGLSQLKFDQRNALPVLPAQSPASPTTAKPGGALKAAVALKPSAGKPSAAAPTVRDRRQLSAKARKEAGAKLNAARPAAVRPAAGKAAHSPIRKIAEKDKKKPTVKARPVARTASRR
jgi:hypothetical protein